MSENEHFLEAQEDLVAITDIISWTLEDYSQVLECERKIAEYLHQKAAKKSGLSGGGIEVRYTYDKPVASRITGIGVLYRSS